MKTYYWNTETSHSNNTVTMDDYLTNHLPEGFKIIYQDDSLAEIFESATGKLYIVNASGDGDFFNHKVEFIEQ